MSRSQERHASFDAAGLRRARIAAGLTNEQLAQGVGVSLRTVQRWQLGANDPQGAQLLRLARAVGMNPEDLYVEEAPAA